MTDEEDFLPQIGRRLAKIVEDSLIETIDETYPDLLFTEKTALLLFTVQLIFADSFLAVGKDRAHCLQGLDLTFRQIIENVNKFYDNKETSDGQPAPTRQ